MGATMVILNTFWIDLIYLAMVIAFFNGAITGQFHTNRKGGGRILIASVKSLPVRIAFLLISVAMIVWLIVDLRSKIGH